MTAFNEQAPQPNGGEIDLTSRNADIVLAAELAVLSAFNRTPYSFRDGEGYISPAGNRVIDLQAIIDEQQTCLEIRSQVAQVAYGFGELKLLEQTFETFGIDDDAAPRVVLTKRFMLAHEYPSYLCGEGANYVDVDRWLSVVSYQQADAFLRANLPSTGPGARAAIWSQDPTQFMGTPTFDWDRIRNAYVVSAGLPELPHPLQRPEDGRIPEVEDPDQLLEAVVDFYADLHNGLSRHGLYGL